MTQAICRGERCDAGASVCCNFDHSYTSHNWLWNPSPGRIVVLRSPMKAGRPLLEGSPSLGSSPKQSPIRRLSMSNARYSLFFNHHTPCTPSHYPFDRLCAQAAAFSAMLIRHPHREPLPSPRNSPKHDTRPSWAPSPTTQARTRSASGEVAAPDQGRARQVVVDTRARASTERCPRASRAARRPWRRCTARGATSTCEWLHWSLHHGRAYVQTWGTAWLTANRRAVSLST